MKTREENNASKRAHYYANRDKYAARSKLWHATHKRNRTEWSRKWRAAHPGYISPAQKQWKIDNADIIRDYSKKHYRSILSDPVKLSLRRELQRSKDFREKWKERDKNRRKNDPQYLLRTRLRARIRVALKGKRGAETTKKLIGCSYEYLTVYIESLFLPGMSWENRHLWHIDHIRPCASFDLLDHEQQRRCFHYTNLQPLWAADNIRKSDTI